MSKVLIHASMISALVCGLLSGVALAVISSHGQTITLSRFTYCMLIVAVPTFLILHCLALFWSKSVAGEMVLKQLLEQLDFERNFGNIVLATFSDGWGLANEAAQRIIYFEEEAKRQPLNRTYFERLREEAVRNFKEMVRLVNKRSGSNWPDTINTYRRK